MKELYTPWGETIDRACPLPEYPRPQLVRDSYLCLNGLWDYTVQDGEEYTRRRTGKILVPFSPESLLSGCDFQLQSGETLWYERTFTLPEGFRRARVLLHFGAVDQCSRVLVNDRPAGHHEGGYLPFCLDITELLVPGENRLTVAVTDDAEGGVYAFGKQRYRRGGIWYTATSGIWQTVWLESVPENYIKNIRLTPDFDEKCLLWHIDADAPAGAHVTVRAAGEVIAAGRADENGDGVSVVPAECFHPWLPEDPYLYDVEITLGDDRVTNYFGMRKFSTVEHKGRRVLALTEFGGYSLPLPGHYTTDRRFGYRTYKSADAWMDALERLYTCEVLPQIAAQGLSAAVYTQLSDVEDEVNGLLTFDRRVCKADAARMLEINRKLRF